MAIIITPDNGEMVGTVRSDGSMSISSPMDPLSTNDSVLRLAHETGMVDAMQQMNNEDSDAAPEGMEHLQPDSEDVEETERRPKKMKKDRRLAELSSKVAETAQERDALARRNQELELHLLSLEREENDRDINSITQILSRAQQENDTTNLVKANKLLSKFTLKQTNTEHELARAQQDLVERQAYDQANTYNSGLEERYSVYQQISHPKELDSEDYQEWLGENEVYNPLSNEFIPSLAEEMLKVKEEYNKYLYAHRRQHVIGTPAYYAELDYAMDDYNQSRYGHSSAPEYDEEEDYLMRRNLGTASVASVQRNSGEYNYRENNLPELTEMEKQFAEKCDMYEGKGSYGSKYGRPLQPHEKHRLYAENKAKLFGGRY